MNHKNIQHVPFTPSLFRFHYLPNSDAHVKSLSKQIIPENFSHTVRSYFSPTTAPTPARITCPVSVVNLISKPSTLPSASPPMPSSATESAHKRLGSTQYRASHDVVFNSDEDGYLGEEVGTYRAQRQNCASNSYLGVAADGPRGAPMLWSRFY